MTRITLDVTPTFNVRQSVYENLPLSNLAEHFEDVMASGYSVSLFTDWQGEAINQVWVKRLATNETAVEAEPILFGATLATVEPTSPPLRSQRQIPQ